MASTADKFYRGRITHRKNFAPDLWRLKIDPGGQFDFVAGQYATLGVSSKLKRIERAYSIVSSPYERELEIFIELVEQAGLRLLTNIVGCDPGSVAIDMAVSGVFEQHEDVWIPLFERCTDV